MNPKNLLSIRSWAFLLLLVLSVPFAFLFADEEPSAQESLPATKVVSMNNQRLGQLLKKHFPKARFTQNGPSVWVIQTEEKEKQAEPPKAEGNGQPAAEAPAAEDYEGLLMVVTDENANRMRIMMPIQPFNPEKAEDLRTALIALHANYDRALDARYAVNEGFLWSAFIHPLRSLTEEDLTSALQQVQTLRKNTGTSYSSGALIFGGGAEEAPEGEEEQDDRTV